jgi:FG-GAP repeat protein/VCBS repeat protein/tetratricopeptide repeat protein
MTLLQSGDASGAVTVLEQLVSAEPSIAYNWRVLGDSCLRAKQFDRALAAFQRVAELEPDRVPFIKLAVVYAVKGDAKSALAWLEKAKTSKRANLSELEHEEAFKPFRDQARFKALLPAPSDFTRPFVEDVKIIREWDGEGANHQFGWIARAIGDVNGDGTPDFVTSAPTHDGNGEKSGRIYVFSSKDGKLLWKADGQPGDMLGSGVEAAGDANGDGIPDVVAGAASASKAYIYSGKDGRILQEFKGESKDDNFGNHVSGIGDVDHDGCADVIIGAPNNSAAAKDAGRAYIYSGRDGHLIRVWTGEMPGDQFGSAVGGSADCNSDLIIVGAPGAGPNHHGKASVYHGTDRLPKYIINAEDSGAALGAMFVSVVGDIDRDGHQDVYVSDWSDNVRGHSTGRIYLNSGKDGHRLASLTGQTQGEGFGTNPGRVGDVDGDGYDDLLVGSWQYSKVVDSGGRICLFSGKTGQLLKSYTCRTPGDTLGFDAVGVGDVDGDGTVDLLVTSGWSGVRGYHSGRVFLISSGVRRTDRPAK